jgi:hypothetical protein
MMEIRMISYLAMPLLLANLSGCDLIASGREKINDVKEKIEGLTNPLVSDGVILSFVPPESDIFDFSNTPYSEGTITTIGLADAKNAADLANAPVTGAAITIRGNVQMDATETSPGIYTVELGSELQYTPNQTWEIDINPADADEIATVTLNLPTPVDLSGISESHTAGESLSVDVTGAGFNSAIVLVLDGMTGSTTYSNEPKTITELYNFMTGDEEITTVDIPAEAFPNQTMYMVGVAGMVHTTEDDITNVNTLLSKFMAGQMHFATTSTIDMDIPSGG